ncbi:radical SAM/CxCxxxxC motif protein YfkAB [Paenibacillus roseipurpureus]|uniref:Radical SAM/CxCxxxxC motif protein YfkAB n=1 Tax=Paenibacillus roseopurpureus TaxID=2918901 RepID=A0AA96LLN5_9BACL|nr:radical SAM/CxCxxxxC motif protein YfkAB [Paenibacillus sp. MBLB1832]WNR43381.1 radical SAM/CxCxxxxC motif protein YfkAB [Paenibacillus sp. MBLB1832]
MNTNVTHSILPEITPAYDPWDPIRSFRKYGKHVLTSVELTITNLCNMRCEHCAVGDSLTMTEGERIPLPVILKRLDEIEHLETISLTGGEPSYHIKIVKDYMLPILKYARDRGIRTQINSNLTLDLERYELLAPYLDVMHISFNYLNANDFHQVGFVNSARPVGQATAAGMYERMVNNTIALSKGGLYVSAESMINTRTHKKLPEIHQLIHEMGCKRHEVHPMYASSFASHLPMVTLDELRTSIHRLLDARNPEMWMLFGTLPFFACNELEADRALVKRLREEPNVTVRNDPDGRNRLNVSTFTGEVFVTDFANEPPLGNLHEDELDTIFARWENNPLNQRVNCFCSAAACCGPNLLVADSYYRAVDFKSRKAII